MTCDEIVLDGELSLDIPLDGDMELDIPIDGEPTNMIRVSDYVYPLYTGQIAVTPSAETQILPTINRTVTDNIVINPIPSNYGLITWNGSIITVS